MPSDEGILTAGEKSKVRSLARKIIKVTKGKKVDVFSVMYPASDILGVCDPDGQFPL